VDLTEPAFINVLREYSNKKVHGGDVQVTIISNGKNKPAITGTSKKP
jgi:hypothetical protein